MYPCMQTTVGIINCVSQQLPRPSYSSFFQSALLRCWQPRSLMAFPTKYKHTYRGLTLSGATTVPLSVVHSPYFRFCCRLTYILITETKDSQSEKVDSAEDHTSLFFDDILICIQPLLPNHNSMFSAVCCLLSLPSISLRTVGMLAAEIFFSPESFNRYADRKNVRLRILSLFS